MSEQNQNFAPTHGQEINSVPHPLEADDVPAFQGDQDLDPTTNPEYHIPTHDERIDAVVDKLGDHLLGAKVLSRANFEQRHKGITDSSFNKARQHGEKLHGSGSERRNEAYLSRLGNLIDTYGDRAEQMIWQKSANRLLVRAEDIPDSYWEENLRAIRENPGYEDFKLTDEFKTAVAEMLQKTQLPSIQPWVDYLSSPDNGFPLWFKVFAWDGMSRMNGDYDEKIGRFGKRRKNTVGPFPELNAAALMQTYEVVKNYYALSNQAEVDSDQHSDSCLSELVDQGNFDRIYSKCLSMNRISVEVPPSPEDVNGEWKEYYPGDEYKLAEASLGTGWCIAHPNTGKSYFINGTSAKDCEYDNQIELKSKFILFHLRDPETSELATSACASIRLSPSGVPVEVSGVEKNQFLSDSLLTIVEEKFLSIQLPDNIPENERQRHHQVALGFKDKKRLLEISQKDQRGEELTVEDLALIYTSNFQGINAFFKSDPLLVKLRTAHGIDECIEKKVPIRILLHGVSPDEYDSRMRKIVSQIEDIRKVIEESSSQDLVRNLDYFAEKGQENAIFNKVAECGSKKLLIENAPDFIKYGVSPAVLAGPLYARRMEISDNDEYRSYVEALMREGVDANIIAANIPLRWGIWPLEKLQHIAGVNLDWNSLSSNWDSFDKAHCLEGLMRHGVQVDIPKLVQELNEIQEYDLADEICQRYTENRQTE